MKMTKEKGITLIALIITIIVMLILVGVTVSVALNGGLFKTTKDAAKDTQIEIDRETLQSAVWGAIGKDGYIDFNKLDSNLPNGFTGSNGKYKSDKGNNFIVSQEDGIVRYRESSTGDLLLLEKYFLGENGEEKDLFELVDPDSVSGDKWIFKDDTGTIPDASTSLQYIEAVGNYTGENDDILYVYFKYNGKIYKALSKVGYVEGSYSYTMIDVQFAFEKQGREGKTVRYSYDGTEENMKDWTILYDDGQYIEIVSPEVMGDLTLGKNDEQAQGSSDVDKAVYSYNNAITRLNEYCETLITNSNKESVRSVGSNPNNKSAENSNQYSSDKFKEFASEYHGLVKGGDSNYESDYIRMRYFGCLGHGTEKMYWFASRTVVEYDDHIEFGIGSYTWREEDAYSSADTMSNLLSAGSGSGLNVYKNGQTSAVRPIVKLPANYGM